MAARRYPPELHAYIHEHGHELTVRDMAHRVEELFGIDMPYSRMKAYYSNHKIHCLPRKGRKRPETRITTPEIDFFIREHVKGTGHQAMADLVNEHFGTTYTKEQMKNYYNRNKLNSGLTGRFEKGHVPENKGKTWDEFMSPEAQAGSRRTTFKKGHIPHNGGSPVGTIRLRHDHKNRGGKPYYWEKTEEPNVWRMKHILVWEEHNGPVPKGYVLNFANGDTTDYRIENLILTTRGQHAIKNREHIRSYNMESAQAANRIADTRMAMTKAKKRQKKGGNQ